jgi:hypothetical protein
MKRIPSFHWPRFSTKKDPLPELITGGMSFSVSGSSPDDTGVTNSNNTSGNIPKDLISNWFPSLDLKYFHD